MKKLAIILFCSLAFLCGIVVGGYAAFGIPGALGAFLLCLLGMKVMAGVIRKRIVGFGKALFDAKSCVLREAEVVVHGVANAPKAEPSDELENEESVSGATAPPAETRFYFLDVTIAPKAREEGSLFQCWDASELELVSFDTPPRSIDEDSVETPERDLCAIHGVQCLDQPAETDDGNGESDEPGKVAGAQRLRLHVEVPKHLRRLKFQYYFESFGDVKVP